PYFPGAGLAGDSRIARGHFIRPAQGPHERDQRSDLRRAEILAICRHIAPALDYLADQLAIGQSRRNVVERRAALTAYSAQAVAIAALLVLQRNGAPQLERRTSFHELLGHGVAAPCAHLRRPGRTGAQVSERPERQKNDDHDQRSGGPSSHALLACARDKWQCQ